MIRFGRLSSRHSSSEVGVVEEIGVLVANIEYEMALEYVRIVKVDQTAFALGLYCSKKTTCRTRRTDC